MNLKKPAIFLAAIVLTTAFAVVVHSYAQSNNSKPSGTTGRYQLATGRVIHRELNVGTNVVMSAEEPVIMKIDTVTGDTWVFECRSTGPGMIAGDTRNHVFFMPDGWSPIRDFDVKAMTDMGPVPSPVK